MFPGIVADLFHGTNHTMPAETHLARASLDPVGETPTPPNLFSDCDAMDRKTYLKAYKQTYRAEKHSVTLTVSRADYQRLVKAARTEGIKPTKLLHDIAFSAFDRSLYVPAELKTQMRELNFLVFNIANNINQIAHWSNSHAQPPDYRRVLAHIETLHQHVVAFTQGRLTGRNQPPSKP
jgi:Bacterial mobilisation protein (MobC)